MLLLPHLVNFDLCEVSSTKNFAILKFWNFEIYCRQVYLYFTTNFKWINSHWLYFSNLNCVVLAKDLGVWTIPIFYRSEYSKRNFLVVSQSTFSNGAPVKTICLVHVDHRYSASYSESLLSASINFFCDYRCHSVKLRACRRSGAIKSFCTV